MDDNQDNIQQNSRGETGKAMGEQMGAQAGGAAGQSVGAAYGGPLGAVIGQYVGEKVGGYIGGKVGDAVEDKLNEEAGGDGGGQSNGGGSKGGGGGCSGGSGGSGMGDYSSASGGCHKTPETPKYKLEIEENKVPENWWDKLPDFDPRVYDSISMEQAAACVNYIFKGLPDMRELEHQMEARKFRKTCPRLKVDVPRTKVIKPKEIIYDTKIDDFIKKDQTY